MKLGEMMENKISRLIKIIKGVYFLSSIPILSPGLDRTAARFFIKCLLMRTRREIENIVLTELFFLYFAGQLAFTKHDDPV